MINMEKMTKRVAISIIVIMVIIGMKEPSIPLVFSFYFVSLLWGVPLYVHQSRKQRDFEVRLKLKEMEVRESRTRAAFQALVSEIGDRYKITMIHCGTELPIASVFFVPTQNEVCLLEEKSEEAAFFLDIMRKVRWSSSEDKAI